jgi:chorismate mutase / prephenate dehydratase
MNKPQTSLVQTSPLNIADVRGQIDNIDAALAELIVRRCSLSAAVSAAKRGAGDVAFGWRPAREIEILRTLLRDQASLDPELALCVWRALISANLASQGALTIHCTQMTLPSALSAFSVGTTPQLADNERDILTQVSKDDHAIGVLEWPTRSHWWVTMMEPQFAALHVCAASPIAGDGPDVLLIAPRLPEPAGDDIALIGGPIGAVEGGIIAQSGTLALVSVGDFIPASTPLPPGCRLIGSFALA